MEISSVLTATRDEYRLLPLARRPGTPIFFTPSRQMIQSLTSWAAAPQGLDFGVVGSGNIVALSEITLMVRPYSERKARLAAARETLLAAGAHIVIDMVADLRAAPDQLPMASGLAKTRDAI